MINYAKHDEEFFGVFKLVNGDEVLARAVLTDDNGETIVFLQDPVCLHIITKEISDGKIAKGIGFTKWMQTSDEEFFILREKDIITIASMSKEFVLMYTSFLSDESEESTEEVSNETKAEPNRSDGYLGRIDEARKYFENLYNNS